MAPGEGGGLHFLIIENSSFLWSSHCSQVVIAPGGGGGVPPGSLSELNTAVYFQCLIIHPRMNNSVHRNALKIFIVFLNTV